MQRPSWEQERELIASAATQLPSEFGLRAWPQGRFRVNQTASYYHEGRQVILLYIDIQVGSEWRSFDKDTVDAIKREMTK